MFDVTLVLGVYLALVGLAVWVWVTSPAPEGYFACAALGFVNFGSILTSRQWFSDSDVSVLGLLVYLASLAFLGGLLFSVGGQVLRTFRVHIEKRRPGTEAGPAPVELSPVNKAIVLVAAGAGSVVVIGLIVSRRVAFLQPGKMWEFYVVLGGIAVGLGLLWVKYYTEKKTRS